MAANALIMIVDDEQQMRDLVRAGLEPEGHEIIEAADANEALGLLDERMPDLIIIDMMMPGMNGMELITEARKLDPCLSIIMMTGHGSVDVAVDAMKHGACDFLAKPFNMERLRGAVDKALAGQALRRQVLQLHTERSSRHGEVGALIVGGGKQMGSIYRTIKQVAKSPTTTVLIQGESGTGKELVAKAIHLASDRRNKRFVDVNCAALTETLLEAELFGYEKGAFTGAVTNGKMGLFEAADGGTIFLDEIGEMGLPLQAKLLRVLQEKRFKRVGGVDDVEVDVRIIASTNRDLSKMVDEGTFRLDLFYRLQVIPISIPPLAERKEDILPIARHYLDVFGREQGKKFAGITPEARAALESHAWPGNVRELKNVIERASILSSTDRIGVESLLFGGSPQKEGPKVTFDMTDLSISEMEKQLIRKVLDNTSWRRTEAARILGINRTTLYNKIRDYALAPAQG